MKSDRYSWAIELLDVRPDDRVLEVGCGPGIGIEMIRGLLTSGTVVGIDRSATAIERASKRNGDAMKTGIVELVRCELAELSVAVPFTKVLAVNVNVFWTSTALPELTALAAATAASARICLGFETPGDEPALEVAATAAKNLALAGFVDIESHVSRTGVVAVLAAPPG